MTLEPITERKVLVVEGKDDRNFFEALIGNLSLSNIQIKDIGGKTQLNARLKALKNTSGFSEVESIGVVRDANNNPNGAFQSVCSALRNANLPVPTRALRPAGQRPEVRIMILPEENTPGMLEDICLRAVEANPAMPCVTQYFECLQDKGLSPPDNLLSKAKVQTFLASKREEVKSLGIAAQKGYWSWDNNAFDHVKEFLQNI
jgi:hypothetical protein